MATTEDTIGRTKKINLTRSARTPFRSYFDFFMTFLTGAFTILTIVPLVALVWDVVRQGIDRLGIQSFTELPPPPGLEEGGFGNAILGTLITLGIAAAISVPFGVLAAIYLSEFGRGTRIAYGVKFATNVLAGIPAILAGLFAYTVVVLTTGGFSAFAGGVALSVVMIPIVVRATEEGLLLVPQEMRQAAVGVGATNFQSISRIVVPAALPSIATAVTLALARAGGEAAPLLFTALNNNFWSTDIWQPIATLPVLIYFYAIIPYEAQKEIAWAAALVLLGIILIVSISSRLLARQRL
ncbi:phosphate ABC transporter permease PstA [Gloeocapsopsis crepidinum LEGE 06123]|uniref:Phosphate transport system permease protein PstA n=1 Tax=Gloeocapsopsis crepidinum LEGE 06123 TaxID=588587 RepID=A0ABR9UNQ4_9CHRO|nr:phosphate ABC transporter permease PstA [Gloeocapsopsis crepidinum]MBE9189912.1 phosphate ABC transporter permease PstA [Gloeocapsopsis crepidinum LEGE 06123]